jgi:lysyl-tRNA synthetase class 2
MKRLLAAGYKKLFQICRCFRKGERGRKHLPEFTLLEWYRSESSYFHLMEDCEALIRSVARQLGRKEILLYQKKPIDLNLPWNRMTVAEAFDRFSPISLDHALAKEQFDRVMALDIEPNLGLQKPVFLYDYPASQAALARLKSGNPKLAQRFELYIAGVELCNGFTELIDPVEQRSRFENERCGRKKRGQRIYPLPEAFLNALSHMPEAAGNALGIDRLVMLFADTARIDDVVAFPTEMV